MNGINNYQVYHNSYNNTASYAMANEKAGAGSAEGKAELWLQFTIMPVFISL